MLLKVLPAQGRRTNIGDPNSIPEFPDVLI